MGLSRVGWVFGGPEDNGVILGLRRVVWDFSEHGDSRMGFSRYGRVGWKYSGSK